MARKRDQRKREKQRAQGGSPYRVVSRGKLAGAYINTGWREDGIASIFMLKTVPGHGHALGGFLGDIWCMGLKDAWGRLDCTYQEFEDTLAEADTAMEMEPVDLDTVRRLVAGGIRFANQNGFRLPPRYERWTAMLGPLDDPDTADLSDFGVDGKLRCVTTTEDLKRRLVGCSVDEYLARQDIEFDIADDSFTLLDDSQLALEEVVDNMAQRVVEAVRKWCFANRVAPHPRLAEAWDIVSEAMMQGDDVPEDPDGEIVVGEQMTSGVTDLLALESPQIAEELRLAMNQIHEFMHQFASADEMMAHLGIDTALDEEDDDEDDDT